MAVFEVKKLSPLLFDNFLIFRYLLYISLIFHKSLHKCCTREKRLGQPNCPRRLLLSDYTFARTR